MKKYILVLVPIIALFFLFFSGLGKNPQELPSVLIGQDLPSEIKTPAEISLVNVWGSWCPACYQEHPYLMKLKQKIKITGLNWAADNKTEATDAEIFLQKYGNPYQKIYYDKNGEYVTQLGVYGAPETFLISKTGKIIYRFAGPLNEEIWQREFLPRIQAEKQK